MSASRRTDIPAFYMDWFMDRVCNGSFTITNPYNGRSREIPASPEDVHCIVFWSKNFGPMLEKNWDRELLLMGYRLFFHFTINSENRTLEPKVPPLEARLEQLDLLCRRHGADKIQWRFDPVCHWHDQQGRMADNLAGLETIAAGAQACGLDSCVTSFVDLYPKVLRRTADTPITFSDPDLQTKRTTLVAMANTLAGYGIKLITCCEAQAANGLPVQTGIISGACIDGRRLKALFGPGLSLEQDRGQRIKSGCRCTISVDVGDYRRHRCRHGCLFCYANPWMTR